MEKTVGFLRKSQASGGKILLPKKHLNFIEKLLTASEKQKKESYVRATLWSYINIDFDKNTFVASSSKILYRQNTPNQNLSGKVKAGRDFINLLKLKEIYSFRIRRKNENMYEIMGINKKFEYGFDIEDSKFIPVEIMDREFLEVPEVQKKIYINSEKIIQELKKLSQKERKENLVGLDENMKFLKIQKNKDNSKGVYYFKVNYLYDILNILSDSGKVFVDVKRAYNGFFVRFFNDFEECFTKIRK